MEHPQNAATIIDLKNFEKEFQYLTFLVDPKNENIHKEQELSVQAGEIVGKLYDALLKAYGDKDPATLRSLNVLCVRIVFCLYAEDAGLFPKHLQFFDYLKDFPAGLMRDALLKLFKILDTPDEKRSKYENQSLLDFPYVNGGLFASQDIDIPQFTEEIKDILLQEASSEFDWSEISPTIFGAVFESTLNPETRRKGGMHYTSITNIHKVIDPLFLDDLKQDFEDARKLKSLATRNKKLLALQDKMAGLTFLDPACGSGNFLTESFTSLRTLENDIIRIVKQGQSSFEFANPIKISISQFYGIEINDFAVSVAKTALWIAESQMMIKTQDIVQKQLDFLPLKSNANIHEGNALRMDWNEVIPTSKLSFIMGNPPFSGYAFQTDEQKSDLRSLSVNLPANVDYVAGWYYKTAKYLEIASPNCAKRIRCAFVSTNSFCQGEQIASVWEGLVRRFNLKIQFAYTTFKWVTDTRGGATVHCVIIGFGKENLPKKWLFVGSEKKEVMHINPYLLPAEDIFITKRNVPLFCVSEMKRGSQATDDGNLILSEEEKNDFLKEEPQATQFIRPFLMGKDFIERKPRYCPWLVNADPSLLKNCPKVLEKVEAVKAFRLKSKKIATQKKAETPSLFDEIKYSNSSYVALPKVSSENRKYIPIDFLDPKIIPGDKLFMIPNASLYEFGVLTSSIHMAWMRTVAGRLKSDYSYSNTIVYNNFPWPKPTDKQKEKIQDTAQKILDVRSQFPNSSFADLYDSLSMPEDLRKAHKANDQAVMQAYGFKTTMTEPEIVAELFNLYEAKVKELEKEEAEVKQKTKMAKRRKQGNQRRSLHMLASYLPFGIPKGIIRTVVIY